MVENNPCRRSGWATVVRILMNHDPYSVNRDLDQAETSGPQLPNFDSSVRTTKIIAWALIAGVGAFLGFVLVSSGGKLNGEPDAMTFTGLVFAAVMIVSHFVIPGRIAKSQLKQAAARGIFEMREDKRVACAAGIFQMQLIIALALLEGAAFLNLIAMMTERSLASLITVSVLLGLMLARFPTRDKVSNWTQDKLRGLM
jgi:hypothetical protein